ncbi:MAG: hypothetical protein ACJ8C4_06770 [Gemmataceae bacterium]
MSELTSIVRTGATGAGKTQAASGDVVASRFAEVILDPEKDSFAATVVKNVSGNFLYDRLDDLKNALGYELLTLSSHPEDRQREFENDRNAKAFAAILLRRRDSDSMATTPLMEEWVTAGIALIQFQVPHKPLTMLPFAYMPDTAEFKTLLRDCESRALAHKFRQLECLSIRALRAEVSSALRLIGPVVNDPCFHVRCRGGFDIGAALQRRCKVVVEAGDAGDDAKRIIMGAIVLKVIEHAKRRPRPEPPIYIRIDEATAAGLVGKPELRGIAQTRKYGLFFDFLGQTLDYPGGSGSVLQNCKRHEWFCCPDYDLARKAAIDILAGLPVDDRSRAERIEEIARDVMFLRPGERWVRDAAGSRFEYVEMLKSPWPPWPGLAKTKLRLKLERVFARPEYQLCEAKRSATSSKPETQQPPSLLAASSPARRLKQQEKRRAAGLPSEDGGNESA